MMSTFLGHLALLADPHLHERRLRPHDDSGHARVPPPRYDGGRYLRGNRHRHAPANSFGGIFGKNNYLFLNEVMTMGRHLHGHSPNSVHHQFLLEHLATAESHSDNPWQATTLEWNTPTPPPHGNFLTEPVAYRGPYEYSLPGADKDFTPQWEKSPGQPEPVIAALPGSHHH
jgi:cytochrome c oxidase subunit I